MKFISPKLHAVIDYLVVAFLLVSPTLFGFTGFAAQFTYALAGIHLLLTILTDFNGGIIPIIGLPVHGLIELLVGVVLIGIAFKIFGGNDPAKMFYICFGIAVLVVWLLSDYNYHKPLNEIRNKG